MKREYYTPVHELSGFLIPGKINYKLFETRNFRFTYPDHNINKNLYYLLTNEECFKGLFHPIDFFNALYEDFELILNNTDCISEVMSSMYNGAKTLKDYFLVGSMYLLVSRLNKCTWLLPPYDLNERDDAMGEDHSLDLERCAIDLRMRVISLYHDLMCEAVFNNAPFCLYPFAPKSLDYGIKRKVVLMEVSSDPKGLEVIESNSERLYKEFSRYGLFELSSVRDYSNDSKKKIIELINSRALPYKIALLNEIGFIAHLEKNYFTTKYQINKKLAEWLTPKDKTGRSIKGNILSLTTPTQRYTAHLHKADVIKDLRNLK